MKKVNNMKIKLSKSQWNFIGRKAGWIKEAKNDANTLKIIFKDGCHICGDCGELVETDYEWLGEKNGVGQVAHHDKCTGCGKWKVETRNE
jgi:hypothetical protein